MRMVFGLSGFAIGMGMFFAVSGSRTGDLSALPAGLAFSMVGILGINVLRVLKGQDDRLRRLEIRESEARG